MQKRILRALKELNKCKMLLACVICLSFTNTLIAIPQLTEIVQGDVSASVSIDPNVTDSAAMQIDQVSNKAILSWDSFNIGTNERVHFQQPVDGVCLNRINSANGMSQIQGKLSSTGGVILINPAGVIIGETAQVNVGGLVASTIDIADNNFNHAFFAFDVASSVPGSIINRGMIDVKQDGDLIFLGNSVSNEGIIKANSGIVMLAGAEKFVLDFNDDGVINYAVESVKTAGVDENGQSLPYGVNVSGKIINHGGAVFMNAKAAKGVFDALINVSGEIRATSITMQRGFILLKGDEQGLVQVTGKLDVVNQDADADGGVITVLGENIRIDEAAEFSAGTDGFVLVGLPKGIPDVKAEKLDFNLNLSHLNITPTQNIDVGSKAKITANAKTHGDGGSIALLSSNETKVNGKISARGGESSGNGGYLTLFSLGKVDQTHLNLDASAANGFDGLVYSSTDPRLVPYINKILTNLINIAAN